MRIFYQDVRSGVRMLARNPGFTLTAVLCLGLGIGACITIFSLFNELFLCPFPVPHQERLVDLNETAPKWDLEYTGICYADFHAWREYNKTFECMGVFANWGANLSVDDKAERVEILNVTHDFLDVLDVRPVLGRGFTPEEDRPQGPKVVLLSFGFWKRFFGQDPTILGRTLRLNDEPLTIIGVLPPKAVFPVSADIWRPLALDPEQSKGSWYLAAFGRLKKGVTVDQAREDLTRIHKGLVEERPANKITSPTVVDLRERYFSEYQDGVSILLGAGGFALLIACCNVTSIMLARGAYRSKEIAMRAALGATRGRIVRHILTESLVLSIVGGILGLFLGHLGFEILLARLAASTDIPSWMTFDEDLRYGFFCIVIVGAATILSGLIPALQAGYARDLHSVLQTSSTHATTSRARRRTLSGVVVGQIALALTLLIGAGLLLRTFRKVKEVDPGFHTEGILTYQISLSGGPNATESQRQAFFEQHLENVRALPGVAQAGLCDHIPLTTHSGRLFDIEGAPERSPDEQDVIILQRTVTPGYFEAMGVKLLSGRFFTEKDNRRDSERTVIVNETFANHFWAGENPVGKRIRRRDTEDWMRVVGLTKDVKHYGFEQEMRPGVYIPYTWNADATMYGVVRTSADPLLLVDFIREIVRSTDPGIPIFGIKTMAQRVDESILLRLIYSWLFGVFATVAGIMAFAGIYGVISYSVSQRTQEIGIRVALGARPGDIARHVMRQGAVLTIIGLLIGLLGSFAISRVLASQLFGVSATDVTTFAGVSILLVAVATLACYIPARRAARIDPIAALRYE
jgi:predicted permease